MNGLPYQWRSQLLSKRETHRLSEGGIPSSRRTFGNSQPVGRPHPVFYWTAVVPAPSECRYAVASFVTSRKTARSTVGLHEKKLQPASCTIQLFIIPSLVMIYSIMHRAYPSATVEYGVLCGFSFLRIDIPVGYNGISWKLNSRKMAQGPSKREANPSEAPQQRAEV